MTKRILALVLAVIMVVTLFAGCNTNDSQSTTTASTTKAATTTKASGTTAAATTAATTAAEETPLLNDLGVLPIVNEEITLTFGLADLGNIVSDLNEHFFWNYLQEQSGIKFEYTWYPSEEMNTKIDLAIAAGGKDLPNILCRDNGYLGDSANAWGADGFLVDLAPYLEEHTYWSPIAVNNSKFTWEKLIATESTMEGALYGFPHYREGRSTAGNFFGARASWAIEAGLVEGYYDEEAERYVIEYDEHGDYFTTWDQALAYLEYVKTHDMNGNGKNDEVPLSTSNTASMRTMQRVILPNFMGRSATKNTISNPDGAGVIVSHYTRDEYRAGVSFIHNQLVETGYLDPLSFTQDDTTLKATASMTTPILGATLFTGNAGFVKLENGEPVLNKDGKTIGDYVAGEGLIVEGYDRARRTYIGWSEKNALITWTCENVEAAVRFLDWMGSEEVTAIHALGEPGVDWQYIEDLPAEVQANYVDPWNIKGVRSVYLPSAQDIEDGLEYAKDSRRLITPSVLTLNGMGVYNATHRMPSTVTTVESYELNKARYLQVSYLDSFSDEEVVTELIYTDEETEENTEIWGPLQSYINECFVAFCLGEMDIDGADWDKYLAELDKMGLSDYVENAQAAYDRTFGN